MARRALAIPQQTFSQPQPHKGLALIYQAFAGIDGLYRYCCTFSSFHGICGFVVTMTDARLRWGFYSDVTGHRMLTCAQAKQLVQSHLDSWAAENACEVAIIDSATLERSFGWVFFYQSKEYLVTGNFLLQLAGNAPLIVNQHTGEVVVTGTAMPLDEHIALYEASLSPGVA